MDSRSDLSREKDEFNFAFILAADLKHYLDNHQYLPRDRRICIFSIYLNLVSEGKAKSEDLQQLQPLLGDDTAQNMFALVQKKAMLETNLVNS